MGPSDGMRPSTVAGFDLGEALDFLKRTPAVLDHLLRGLPPGWYLSNEGPGTWSPFDVVGHLIHAEETDWVPRVRHILEHGNEVPFPPFDRVAMFERFRGKSLAELLDHFARARHDSLIAVREWNLAPEQLLLAGLHPELGAVSLSQLLATWVVHDLTHLNQISRALARKYGEAVGPWAAYLSILRP